MAGTARYVLRNVLRCAVCLAAALPKKKTISDKNAVLCLPSPSSTDKAVMFIKPPFLSLIMLYKTEPVV